jgi:hypothetical protein
MLTAIDFNNQLGGMTAKVDDVIADWDLTSEMRAADIDFAQTTPQALFRIGRGGSKTSGTEICHRNLGE